MAINLDRYVEITSTVGGAQSVDIQRLVGRVFTSNQLLPVNTLLEVRAGGADDYFGSNSIEAQIARQYFAYVSPPPASQADTLQFFAYTPTGREATIYGAPIDVNISTFTSITNGTFNLSLYGVDTNGTGVDFSGDNTWDDLATTFSNAIVGAAITYDAPNTRFVLKASSIANGTISMPTAVGVDIGGLFGFQSNLATTSDGQLPQTAVESFIQSEEVSDSFGSATFLPVVSLSEAEDLSLHVQGRNVKYQLYWSVDSSTAATWSTQLKDIASTGLILNDTTGEYKQALPMAIMASTDYDRRNAAVNYMFRQVGGLTPDVKRDSDADTYDNLRVNYYGQTATVGQNISFFQRGYLCGTATDPLDMGTHSNEQFLKAYLRSRLMSMFLGIGRIPANIDGRAIILSVVQESTEKALFNGIILVGTTLSAIQRSVVTQITGDPLAYHDIENKGVWMDAQIVSESVNGVETHTCKYTLIYKKADMIRKVDGSHSLI